MATVLDLLEQPALREAALGSLRRRDRDGATASRASEDRLLISGLDWEAYEAVDTGRSDELRGSRLFYLDGVLEIMGTSSRHEELKKWLATLLEQYFIARRVPAYPRGQATIKRMEQAGAEPDESWSFGERKETPDLVLEIALSSGGLPKLAVYERLAVPEVWLWREDRLEVWALGPDGYVGPLTASLLLPDLPVECLAECARLPDWMEAIERFREVL